MKRFISIALLLFFAISGGSVYTFAGSVPSSNVNPKEQIHRLQQQVEKLTQGYNRSDPLKTANLYGKALQERNGALYLVAVSDENQKKHIDYIEESNFTIGVSSPWVARYQVVSCQMEGEKDATVVMRITWKTSTDEVAETRTLKLHKQEDGNWKIISNAEPW